MEALVAPFSLHLGSNSSINALRLIFKYLALAAAQAMINDQSQAGARTIWHVLDVGLVFPTTLKDG